MPRIKRYTKEDGGYHGELAFFCPGCNCRHFINDKLTDNAQLTAGQIWTFNGNFNKPTIRASVLTRNYQYNPLTKKYDTEIERCHSFVTDGNIQFLNDCQHSLAGKTCELPEIE